MEVKIYVDGGCKGNGTANAACYGSYAVQLGGRTKRQEKLTFPQAKTNNQAEYLSLISAQDYLIELAGRWDIASTVDVIILMDSALVVNQVNETWRVKDWTLGSMCMVCFEKMDTLVKLFKSVKLVQTGRNEIVKVLGH